MSKRGSKRSRGTNRAVAHLRHMRTRITKKGRTHSRHRRYKGRK